MASRAETYSVRLPEDIRPHGDEIAKATRRSPSHVIEEAVEVYVRERAPYVASLEEAVASAGSGVGHSSGQIFEWMHSWGRDDERPSPMPDLRPAD